MAHFAEIENGIVVQVIVVHDNDAPTEADGLAFLAKLFPGRTFKQTSYNTRNGVHSGGKPPLRKNYAGVGFTYDAVRDAFIPPKPFASWTLNEQTGLYDPPAPYPADGKEYAWNEPTGSWKALAP